VVIVDCDVVMGVIPASCSVGITPGLTDDPSQDGKGLTELIYSPIVLGFTTGCPQHGKVGQESTGQVPRPIVIATSILPGTELDHYEITASTQVGTL
jgi:hypothetical protein